MKKVLNKLLNTYKNINLGVKVSIWFTFCNFFQKGISMLSVPIFTRLMTTDEYGVYSVYQSWYQILTVVVTLNLFAGVYNKGLVKYEDDKDRFTSSMQGLSTLTTVLFFLIYIVAIDFWTKVFELIPIYMIAMFMELLFVPAYSYWSARQRFEYRYKGLVIVTVIMSLSSPVVGILAVLTANNKAFARVMAYAAVQACIGLLFFIYNIYKGKNIYVKEYWKYALAFNLPLIPHYLSQIVLNQADRIMISRIVDVGGAAIYSVAYNISLIMSLFTNAINSTFVPSLYNSLKNNAYENIKKNSDYVIIIAAALTALAMLFGPELIAIFAPAEYQAAVWIIPPVSMSVYFIAVYSLFVNIEFYFEKTKYVMYVSVAGAVLNILLNWVFITKYGYIAAGYTTVFCYLLFSAGHYLLYRYLSKKYLDGISIIDAKLIGLVTVVLMFIMMAVLVLYKFSAIRYSVILLIALTTVIKRKQLFKILKVALNKNKS